MKKSLIVAAVSVLVAGSAYAILPPVGYIGVFADANHDAEVYWVVDESCPEGCYTGGPSYNICPAQYAQFEAWIWCLPSVNGLQAAEFAVSFPATTVTVATAKNPLIAVELGSLTAGISVALAEGSCQYDWTYLYTLTMLQLGTPMVPAQIMIIPHPGTLPVPAHQFANCLPGYPIEECINLVPLYICHTYPEGPVGVRQTNWGAIKSLF